MASFLQNHGDIILDAVLTDYGRKLLAKGDGSFNIVKFAFGDDEIDYNLYDASLPSSQRDLRIMQTPILEAFTNNAASMKSMLITIGNEKMLYMPVMKLNTLLSYSHQGTFNDVYSGFVVPVETATNRTKERLLKADKTVPDGVLTATDARYIVIDQGINSRNFQPDKKLKTDYPELYESEYNVYVDNRFCTIEGIDMPLSVDDDNIAVYKMTEQSTVNNPTFVTQIEYKVDEDGSHVIVGAKGSRLQFRVKPSVNLYSDNYFDKYGIELALNADYPDVDFKTLKTNIKIVGVTTGYTVDVQVLFAKVIV